MPEKQTDLKARARRFRSLPEEDKSSKQKSETLEPSAAFSERNNGKITQPLKK